MEQVRASAGLSLLKCGPMRALWAICVVRALKIMLQCGCGPPQDNEVWCDVGAGLASVGRCGCGPEISARADLYHRQTMVFVDFKTFHLKMPSFGRHFCWDKYGRRCVYNWTF